MQKIKILPAFLILLMLTFCGRQGQESRDVARKPEIHKQLPRVLIITTGLEGSNATLPKGIVIALQAFNQQGAIVRLEPRDILYQPERLKKFNVIILSTAPGYHDADREYSLSFMADAELENIREFVKAGGVLISGDNVGRNKPGGTDRIVLHGQLTPANYPLAYCYGLELSEKNMEGYQIYGHLSGNTDRYICPEAGKNFYTLVPDTMTSDHAKVLARWINDTDTLPAIIKNRYGKGTSYLLASSDFLHPANEGGFMSTKKITGFYHKVLKDFRKRNQLPLHLNPWPNGYKYAFCVTMNADGNLRQYKRVRKLMAQYDLSADYFVNGNVKENVREFMNKEELTLQSNGYTFDNYRNFNYSQSIRDILKNEHDWKRDFSGFRFPYTMPGFWGVMALSEQNYNFESSIGANNLEFIHGSVAPHNLVMASEGYYRSTDIMELAPTYHDDYFYLKNIEKLRKNTPRQMVKKAKLYEKYLNNFWNYAVKPYNGVMVYQGHPRYVANNDTTIQALENLIDQVENEPAWMTTAGDIACFRKNLMKLRFYVNHKDNKFIVNIIGPDDARAENVCLIPDFAPAEVNVSSGEGKIQKDSTRYHVVFDAFNGQRVVIRK